MQKDNKEKRNFYLTLYAVATVFLLMAFAITILNTTGESGEAIENASPVDKSNVKPVIETTTINTGEITEATTESSAKVEESTEVTTVNTGNSTLSIFNDDEEMLWPVSGQILMDYNTTTAVFDKTLEQYRTNDSICISAPLGSPVCASADGIVTSITKDEEKGVTVSIDHGNGWLSTYSQLKDNVNVSEGQAVFSGEKIGSVNSIRQIPKDRDIP